MTGHEERAPTWRRAGPHAWRSHPGDGDLAEDGAELFAFRTDLPDEYCPACGRRRVRWRLDVALPSPFPVVSTVDIGCSRRHALSGVPVSWAGVAGLFAVTANAVRGADPFTEWDARHAAMRDRQAVRAAWLSNRNGQARRLALRLWSDNPTLDVGTMEAAVSAVLSEPPGGKTTDAAVKSRQR